MEKSRSEILSEIRETLAELKARIAEAEERLAALEAVEEPLEVTEEVSVDEEIPAAEDDMSPIAEEEVEEESILEPKVSINDRQERKARKAVVDVMGQKLAWKTAMPGTPVKNVISAISLNDRVLFINTLFKEDPMAFQEAIAAFNAMSSFDEAEEYVRANHPDWNLNSDLVFRLMMAVRRKLK